MAEKKTNPAAVWATTLFLAAVFLLAGWTMVTGNAAWDRYQVHYADWFLKTVGIIAIASALLLLIPKTAWIGASMLAVLMVGALVTELLHGQPMTAVFWGLFLISLSALAYYRFPRQTPPPI